MSMMKKNELLRLWQGEEEAAQMHGWDFSHLRGRYEEARDLPWNYRAVVAQHLRPEMKLLDMETGGGEFLLSLGHPLARTAATEGYAPNVALCEKTLRPLGVDFRAAQSGGKLPFPDESFDLVINRHGAYDVQEIRRVLKPGGVFVTQQVGAQNDRELVELLCGALPLPFPSQTLAAQQQVFEAAGFLLLDGQEYHGRIRFGDVGALVWFARVIPWEFPGFSVESSLDGLWKAQQLLEEKGRIDGTTHRFLLVARKKN